MASFKGFIGSAYRMASLPISAQRCINWYPETQDNGDASSLYVLQPIPGYSEIVEIDDPDLPAGSYNRGMYRTSKGIGLDPDDGGSIVTVIGPYLYWVYKELGLWVWERLGQITNYNSKVSFTDDGFGMLIADQKNIYRLNLKTKSFGNVGFNLQNPTDVDFMGGYSLVIGVDETTGIPQNTFFWSDLYNNALWDALDYASAEQSQDPITAMIVSGTYIYLFGPNSYELWSASGDKDLPFQRAYASSGAIGIYAPKSLCKFGNSVFMLGTNGGGSVAAYQSNGTEMTKISTIALDQEWQSIDTTDCTTFVDSHDGHDFVMFNFDNLDKTYVYDINSREWHERASRDELTDTLHRWEPNYAIHTGNTTLVGDRTSNKLFLLGKEYTTENGRNILRIRTTSHQNAEQKPLRIDAVRFDMETGNGITNEDPFVEGSNRYTEAPTIMFRYSQDRGRTWSSEIRQTFGATGEYLSTVEYARLGVCRNFTVEFKISDACHTSILNGWIYPVVAERTRRG